MLMLLTEGLSPHDTVDALEFSEATVRNHMQRLFTKTGTSGQHELDALRHVRAGAGVDIVRDHEIGCR